LSLLNDLCKVCRLRQGRVIHSCLVPGEVSEWSKEHAWKVCKSKGFEGSNPSLTATYKKAPFRGFFFGGEGGVRTLAVRPIVRNDWGRPKGARRAKRKEALWSLTPGAIWTDRREPTGQSARKRFGQSRPFGRHKAHSGAFFRRSIPTQNVPRFCDKLALVFPHPSPLPEGEGILALTLRHWVNLACGSRLVQACRLKTPSVDPPLSVRDSLCGEIS
jgi:hypothetical protein